MWNNYAMYAYWTSASPKYCFIILFIHFVYTFAFYVVLFETVHALGVCLISCSYRFAFVFTLLWKCHFAWFFLFLIFVSYSNSSPDKHMWLVRVARRQIILDNSPFWYNGWDHFGIILGSFWDHLGIILAWLWDHLGNPRARRMSKLSWIDI